MMPAKDPAAYSRAYRAAHPEKTRESRRLSMEKWRRANPELHALRVWAATHGLSEERAREIRETMPSVCETCDLPPGGKGPNAVLHYDHDHATGKHRGWLCGPCNRALGAVRDDPAVLRRLADYLER